VTGGRGAAVAARCTSACKSRPPPCFVPASANSTPNLRQHTQFMSDSGEIPRRGPHNEKFVHALATLLR
jgi:hypothetical protein